MLGRRKPAPALFFTALLVSPIHSIPSRMSLYYRTCAFLSGSSWTDTSCAREATAPYQMCPGCKFEHQSAGMTLGKIALEPVGCPAPGKLGRRLVIPWCRVVVEPMIDAWVDVSLIGLIVRL